jgi:hypothetical protein
MVKPSIRLSAPDPSAIELNRTSVLQICKLVEDFGKMKDFKEGQLDLAEALVKGGFSPDLPTAEKYAGQIMTQKFGPMIPEERARELYKYFQSRDPLGAIAKDLEAFLAED